MPTIYNADPSELIEKTSEELKKIESIKPPVWAAFVKTGMHKERPPVKNDWWYMRAASILRKIYRLGPIGVSKLRVNYGGKKNRGYKTEHFYKGSGNILRKIMQQLEKEGFVKIDLKSKHKGRLITAKGKKFLDDIAGKISNVRIEQKKEEKREELAKEIKKEETPKAEKKADVKEETKKEKSPEKEAAMKEAKQEKSEQKTDKKEAAKNKAQ